MKKELKIKVFEAIGEAIMCWNQNQPLKYLIAKEQLK